MVLLSFLAFFQVGLISAYRFAAEAAAHGGARSAVVASGETEVALAVNEITLAILHKTAAVELRTTFGHAEVSVTLEVPWLVPGLSRFFGRKGGLLVTGRCSMIQEPV